MKPISSRAAALAAAAVLVAGTAEAQQTVRDATEKEIERYRAMISDPMSNPGFLYVDRGEQLWALKRGKKNVSLETCDLGEGPGKLDGAFAKLPRFFADANKVMDLEARLVWCMEKVQELDTKDILAKKFSSPGKTSDLEDLTAFVSNRSSGMKFQPQTSHPAEKAMLAVGEELFYRRAGVSDFSCATCHGESGKRIRLQGLPDLSKPGKEAQEYVGGWPAYRVSLNALRTMQHRLFDCFRQMRWAAPVYGSDALTALTLFLNKQAEGGVIQVPSMKR